MQGIGKTTAVHLVAKELGFDVVELNASDARNKASLDATVRELIGNHTVAEFFRSDKTVNIPRFSSSFHIPDMTFIFFTAREIQKARDCNG